MRLQGSGVARKAVIHAVLCMCVVATAYSQGRPLTVGEVARILRFGGEDDMEMPEFLAAVYGPRARAAVEAILEKPATVETYSLQLSALTAAQYPRIGVNKDLLIRFVVNDSASRLPPALREILGVRAAKALSTQPNAQLRAFWIQMGSDPRRLYRQFVPVGLACALGEPAIVDLQPMSNSPDSVLSRRATNVVRELTLKGSEARVCGRTSRISAPSFPDHVRPEIARKGETIRREIP